MPPADTFRFDPPPRTMSREAFQEKFGAVYEHFPEVARNAWAAGLSPETDAPDGLAAAMADAARAMHRTSRMKLIRNHPDLAGRAAIAGELTAASTSEQADAGLDRCTPEEFARFQTLNKAYRAKFGFPFILAVGGRSRAEILAAFEARLQNDANTEFAAALAEIDRIALLRLQKLAGAT